MTRSQSACKLGIVLLCWSLCVSGAGASALSDGAKIRLVETGLRPTVTVQDEPREGWNIFARMEHHQVPAVSIAVIADGRVAWTKAYGVTEQGGSRAATPQTLFQAASISKAVAALGTLQLVEQGKLDLDADVNGFLTSWKLPASPFTSAAPLTLRRIMSHTGGLTVHGFEGYQVGEPLPTLVQILDGVAPASSPAVRSEAVPGTTSEYSGGGVVIEQLAVQGVIKDPYEQFLAQKVLAPLGMTHSTFQQPLPVALAANAASGHDAAGSPIRGGWHVYPEIAAAGLWTTAADLGRYIVGVQHALLGQGNFPISQQMTEIMLKPQLRNARYGLGPAVWNGPAQGWFGHLGANAGFRGEMIGYMHQGIGAVVLTNGDDGLALCDEVINAVAAAYHWPHYLHAPKHLLHLGSDALAGYAGTYTSSKDDEVAIEVKAEDGKLQVGVVGDAPHAFWPQGDNRFFLRELPIEVQFVLDSAHRPREVHIFDDGLEILQGKRH